MSYLEGVQYTPLLALFLYRLHIATTATTFILHLLRLNHSILTIHQRGDWRKTQSYYLNAIATLSDGKSVGRLILLLVGYVLRSLWLHSWHITTLWLFRYHIIRIRQGPIFISKFGWMTRLVIWVIFGRGTICTPFSSLHLLSPHRD